MFLTIVLSAVFASCSAYYTAKEEGKKCYGTGERCAGSAGMAHVEYLGCCNTSDECVADSAMGYGKFYKKPLKKSAYVAEAPKKKPENYKLNLGYKPNEPSCYNSRVRCAGASGHPAVKRLGCCDDSEKCLEDKSLGYGKFCKKAEPESYDAPKKTAPEVTGPKCYMTMQRCAGAAGHPAVKWLGCCNKNEQCLDDKSLGYGKFCKKPEPKTYVTPEKAKPEVHGPNCYMTTQRCAGAPGYPAVKWMGCCKSGDVCIEDSKLGYGRFCKAFEPKYETKKYITTTAAPATTTTTKDAKCHANAVFCGDDDNDYYGENIPCCAGLECQECAFKDTYGYGSPPDKKTCRSACVAIRTHNY